MHAYTQTFAQVSPIGPMMHPSGRNRFLPGQALYNLGITCIYYKLIQSNLIIMKPSKPRSNRKINKIFYILILMAVLLGILFYLDILNYLSLQNVVSVILGFLIMIIVQMRFISYYFQDKMEALDLDEVGVVKDFIKNKIFGEINLNYIVKKQKVKYYQYTKDENDRLFDEENSETFNCVMAVLRAKNQINNSDRLEKLKERWEVFIAKIGQFEAFLSNLHKHFKEKTVTYNKKFNDKTTVFKDEDYRKWRALFSPQRHIQMTQATQPSKQQLQNYDPCDWLQLKAIMNHKFTINESITKQISTVLMKQYDVYAVQMRAEMRKATAELQTSDNQNAASRRTYKQIIEKIKTTNQKIENLIKKFNQKTKGTQNMELIVNTQYDLRFLRLQLENLQVRKTYAKDMKYKNSQSEYKLCEKLENILEDSGIRTFNNKMAHLLMRFFEKVKPPIEKNKELKHSPSQQDEFPQMKDIESSNIKQGLLSPSQLQGRLNQFKNYLDELETVIKDEISSCRKINTLIKNYDDEWKNKGSQFRFGQETNVSIRMDDRRMFLKMIESVNQKEIEVLSTLINILKEQQAAIFDKKKQKKENLRKSHEDYDSELKNKLPSCLPEALLCFSQGYSIIMKQVEEKREQIDKNSKDQATENPRILKMNEYKDEIAKLEKDELFQEENEMTNVKDAESLKFANRLIDVFAAEWRNSQFFHEILKEEIQLSLNTKRPPILSYMTVKYIKIHEKQPETIKSLKVSEDNVYTCSFQLQVNFDGKIAVHIQTCIKTNKKPVNIRLLITHFKCPIQVCFTPFQLGKSNVCMKETPELSLEYSAKIGDFELTKIPFLSLFIKLFIVIKLRKKFLYPKKATIKVPMAVKNAISEAIKQRVNFQKMMEKKKKSN